jgi:hypothetical protein
MVGSVLSRGADERWELSSYFFKKVAKKLRVLRGVLTGMGRAQTLRFPQ